MNQKKMFMPRASVGADFYECEVQRLGTPNNHNAIYLASCFEEPHSSRTKHQTVGWMNSGCMGKLSERKLY